MSAPMHTVTRSALEPETRDTKQAIYILITRKAFLRRITIMRDNGVERTECCF